MKLKTCHILGAGIFCPQFFQPEPDDYIICADGGITHLAERNIVPQLLLGDFDSMSETLPHQYPAFYQQIPEVKRYPVEKDDTDMQLAVNEALSRGYNRLLLHGGTGGRIDHTAANFRLLSYIASKQAIGYLIGETYLAASIENAALSFPASQKGILSVFCNRKTASGVTLKGLKYPLTNATLTYDVSLGVSNAFTGGEAKVSVTDGSLTVIWYHQGMPYPLPFWTLKNETADS